MIANYHTHTWRCNHAFGTEREYVENAVKMGMKTLGFSDHGPYIFPEGYYSGFRMTLQQLPGYCETLMELRKAFAGVIEIPIGLELEYYPALLPKLLPILRDQPLDYLILGQHLLGNEVGERYTGAPTDDKKDLERYCDQTIEAMHTGLYTYFAHPDVINFIGNSRFYGKQMRRICREASSCGMPLELNLLGLAEGRNYPNRIFWEMAAEEGCAVILGRDAHTPQALLDEETEERALKLVGSLGLELLPSVPLRKI